MSNVTLPGTGAVIATDTVASKEIQIVKLDVGGPGASVPVVGALPVSASALPLPAGAATETSVAATAAASGTVADAVWSGSGSGSVVAVLKAIWSKLNAALSVKVFDKSGAGIDSLSAGAGQNALNVAQTATNFILSTNNSSVAQLAGGATFTGVVETIFNQQDISIMLVTDQAITLTIRQYEDAAGLIQVQPVIRNIPAGGSLNRSFPCNGNYAKIEALNTSGTLTTTFALNVAYGTLSSVSNLGNAPVSLDEVNGTAFTLGSKVSASSLPVVVASDQTVLVGNASAASQSGSFTASAQSVILAMPVGATGAQVFVSGTYSGINIGFTVSYDGGVSYQTPFDVYRVDTGAQGSTTGAQTNASIGFNIFCIKATHVQVASSSFTSGTMNVVMNSCSTMVPHETNVNASRISGNSIGAVATQGSTTKALSVQVSGASSSTLTTTAWAGSGSVAGAVQAIADGGGVAAAFDINVTALTLGTATAVLFVIQESYDNGTTYTDIWVTDPVTATGHVRVPPININGRLRVRAFSVGGTSTTVTTTTTISEIGAQVLVQRQWRDVYAATNPFTSGINGVSTASALVSTTLNSTSSVALIEGCKNVQLSAVFTGGTPTVGPTYTLQVSNDALNWFSTAVTLTPSAAGLYIATLNNNASRFARVIVSTASTGGTAYGVSYVGINGIN